MAVVSLLTACLAAALTAYLAVGLIGDAKATPRRNRRGRRKVDVRAYVRSLLELLGHTAAVARVAGWGPPRRFARSLQGALRRRGTSLTLQGSLAALAVWVVSCCLVCWWVSWSALGLPVGLAAGVGSTAVFVGNFERAQRDARAAQMPEVLRSLSAALGAGKSLSQAIEHVGMNLPEPMGTEFLRASFEIKGGCSVEEAIESLCSRVDAPGISLLGTSLQISQRTGSSLNDLFARTSRMVTDTVGLRRELQVKTSQVRLSARVVAAMPVVLCGVLTLLSADYRAGLELQAGRSCLMVAALLDVVALLIVRRTMSRSLE